MQKQRAEDIFDGPKTVHIYSSLTNSQEYPVYGKSPQGDNILHASVHIKGGAHRAQKTLITELGILTSVSEKALEHLRQSKVFNAHVEAGRITVRRDMVDIEKAVADHDSYKDPSAPITPEDFMNVDPNDPNEVKPIPTTLGAERGKGRKVVTRNAPEWKA
jgi:hypothetical protein